jgi:hypothetical protein
MVSYQGLDKIGHRAHHEKRKVDSTAQPPTAEFVNASQLFDRID